MLSLNTILIQYSSTFKVPFGQRIEFRIGESEKDQRKEVKHQRKISLELAISYVNGPYARSFSTFISLFQTLTNARLETIRAMITQNVSTMRETIAVNAIQVSFLNLEHRSSSTKKQNLQI